jgi:hypothetical protein
MRAFLDFEASSLSDDSYPIEVAWVFEDGRGEAWLIRPAADWTDWDAAAEATHKISRATLAKDGADHGQVARRALEALSGHALYASAPSWDGKWLSVLLRGAGLPRHALRLSDTDVACVGAVAEVLGGDAADERIQGLAARLITEAKAARKGAVRHRAHDDARAELALWQDVRRRAEALASPA